ncbi:MAG: hypothetical protein QOD53_1441, partial [Thermoleophilaceae bacterium]|nr:hypothetical protein [Thermoleophilaceae bacterium]
RIRKEGVDGDGEAGNPDRQTDAGDEGNRQQPANFTHRWGRLLEGCDGLVPPRVG